MREFERWTTTTVNAFTQPMFDRYMERLEKGLASQGFHGRLYIMASSGGTLPPIPPGASPCAPSSRDRRRAP